MMHISNTRIEASNRAFQKYCTLDYSSDRASSWNAQGHIYDCYYVQLDFTLDLMLNRRYNLVSLDRADRPRQRI